MKRVSAVILLAALLATVPLAWAWGTLEDFTAGWTHVDDNNKLGVGANNLTSTTVSETYGAYHTKSYGASHFGDFQCRFTGDYESGIWSTWANWRLGFANAAGYWPTVAASGDSVWVEIYRNASGPFARIVSVNAGVESYSTASDTLAADTTYYFEFTRSGTSLSLTIWTGGYGVTQFASLNLTGVSTTLEYAHAWNARAGDTGNVPWDLQDLDLSGGGGGGPYVGHLKQTLNNPVLHGDTLSGGLYE